MQSSYMPRGRDGFSKRLCSCIWDDLMVDAQDPVNVADSVSSPDEPPAEDLDLHFDADSHNEVIKQLSPDVHFTQDDLIGLPFKPSEAKLPELQYNGLGGDSEEINEAQQAHTVISPDRDVRSLIEGLANQRSKESNADLFDQSMEGLADSSKLEPAAGESEIRLSIVHLPGKYILFVEWHEGIQKNIKLCGARRISPPPPLYGLCRHCHL